MSDRESGDDQPQGQSKNSYPLYFTPNETHH